MAATYDPAFYDIVNASAFRDDIAWYRARAREVPGPVLELGAGTGRITIPIAQDNHSICALDADPGMLDALRQKLAALPADVQQRVTITAGDMRSFTLNRRFALVIAPFRAFLHNLTTDDQMACLRRIVDHLEPGGCFAFNVFHPSLEYMARNTGPFAGVWRWRGTYALPDGGHLVSSDATQYDTIQKRVHSIHRHDRCGADGNVAQTFVHRLELAYLYLPDIRHLLQDAGFAAVEVYGDFHGKPFDHDTDELVIVSRL